MSNCTKAIIPVAGWGTRWLPITKTIEKCMLPIANRPIIDYSVQDCIKAGIKEIIFVVGEESRQLKDYYSENVALDDYLKRNNKSDKLPLIEPPKDVEFHFVVQPSYGKYGTAVPVSIASDYVNPGESVLVVMGDDFFYNEDGSSEMARFIENTPEGESGILAAVLAEDNDIIGRYGMIYEDENGYLERVIEHPDVLPEPFVKNVAKYILSYDMLRTVCDYVDTGVPEAAGEYYIFAPFEKRIEQGSPMKVVHAKNDFFDGGNLRSWLYANEFVMRGKI